MGGSRAKACWPAFQKLLDERDAVGEVFCCGLRQSDVLRAAMAGANAEHGTAVRDMVERGNRRGADCRMTRQEIGDAKSNPRPLRGTCNHRRRHPGVHRISGRIGDADHCIAMAVGALGEPFAKVESIGPEEEPDLHLEPAFGVDCEARGGQRGMMTPSTTVNKPPMTKPNKPTKTKSAYDRDVSSLKILLQPRANAEASPQLALTVDADAAAPSRHAAFAACRASNVTGTCLREIAGSRRGVG